MSQRLDQYVLAAGHAPTRSQAENLIRLGSVSVNGVVVRKPGFPLKPGARVSVSSGERYVSRAGLKLASVATLFRLDFSGATVLDVGSSTGGFTDYALQHGAKLVVAVDVGTDQLHPTLRGDTRVELHEKTDIRNFMTSHIFDIIVIDVSFISLSQILPDIARLVTRERTKVVAMVKPQFEAGRHQVNKGIIKNETVRRHVLRDVEAGLKQRFLIRDKADSTVSGAHGNRERFYLLTPIVS